MVPPAASAAASGAAAPLVTVLAESRGRIDAALDELTRFGPGCPETLLRAIRYALLAPGKRLRPTLVLWGSAACGCHAETALPAACAVEMVHAYSLVHDDLPAMDDDDLRRGRPTCHKVYGQATAILVGDALLARAFEVLARGAPAGMAADCVAALAEAAGATALVGGQADDLAGNYQDAAGPAGGSPEGALAALQSIHERKTGAMFRVSLRLAGLVAGADLVRQAALEEYGGKLGLAFQIADDLLDEQGSEAALGKRVGKDRGRGKFTFPGLLGVAESRRHAERLIDEAIAALAPLGPAAGRLAELARFVLERNR